MIKDKLQEQFENMLPFMQDKFKTVIKEIILQAELLDNSVDDDPAKIKTILKMADSILSTNKKLIKLME